MFDNKFSGWLGAGLLALVVLAPATALAQRSSVVTTVRVTEQPISANIELIGTLKANQQVAIAPQVSARVTQVHFVPGQVVKKDQLLLSLDDRAAQAAVREARSVLMDAQRISKNYQTLFKRKAVTQTEVDGQQAAVAMAEAKLAAARVAADYLTLRAPFAGVMGLTDVAPGMLLAANTPVAELLDISSLKLDLAVPEKYFGKLSVGEQLTAYTQAYGEQVFIGELAVIAPSVNSDTLNAEVRLVFDNSDELLVPGMLMRVQLIIANNTQMAIPAQSLLYAGQQRYVYVVDDQGKVSRRNVSTGLNLGDMVTIANGLEVGEQVIREGTVKVREGSQVEVINEAL
ncbi:MAG: efflux RND transporter periplasmic adaptor subunit [Oceanisphaera sp.]|uniref:efflux RND transporter periplasmic adaptor subunit n=1 Tax=Oceanisphaera sp. TaxID=1929979 RepID=UPI003C753E4F